MHDIDIVRDALTAFDNTGFIYGDLITHEWLDYELKIPVVNWDNIEQQNEDELKKELKRIEFIRLRRIELFKYELLVTQQIAVESIKGEGYRLVHPNDQAMFALQESMRQIQNAIKKGHMTLKFARLEEMEQENRQRHIDSDVKMAALNQLIRKERRDVFLPFNKPEK